MTWWTYPIALWIVVEVMTWRMVARVCRTRRRLAEENERLFEENLRLRERESALPVPCKTGECPGVR